MHLHNLQPQIRGPEPPITVPPKTHEILLSEPTPSTLPEIPEGLPQQPPVELVCQSSPIGGSPIRSNDQPNDMHVLIVDDNDINLRVCYLTANSITQNLPFLFCISVASINSLCLTYNQILATLMRKRGCSYDTASNGLIALELVESSSRRYDLILMGSSTTLLNTPPSSRKY